MKWALVQMTSTPSVEENLRTMVTHLTRASKVGASAALFPENCLFLGDPAFATKASERIQSLDALSSISKVCRRARIAALIGSYPEKTRRGLFNTSLWIDAQGEVAAKYRKVHLFDATTPRGERYHESDFFLPGKKSALFSWKGLRIGMSVCYDIRFSDAYLPMKASGVDCILIPSAFTIETGEAHWHVLNRARAVENFAFVFSPAQTGIHPTGRKTFGHSLAVSPWGEILADLGKKPGLRVVDFDPSETRVVRRRFGLA